MCAPLSQILANAVLLLLSATMSAGAFMSYGWRIPFVLSFVLVLVGIYIRLRVAGDTGVRARCSSPLSPRSEVRYGMRSACTTRRSFA